MGILGPCISKPWDIVWDIEHWQINFVNDSFNCSGTSCQHRLRTLLLMYEISLIIGILECIFDGYLGLLGWKDVLGWQMMMRVQFTVFRRNRWVSHFHIACTYELLDTHAAWGRDLYMSMISSQFQFVARTSHPTLWQTSRMRINGHTS